MKKLIPVLAALVASLAMQSLAHAASHDPTAIAALMPSSKLSLVEGIKLAETSHGPATSAKFEVNDEGKLVLSIYTIPEGFDIEPEKATLSEIAMDPTAAEPGLRLEKFEDKEHIARSAAHMTLFRLSRFKLTDVLEKAAQATKASPIDVRNPTIVDKHPVADIILLDQQGKAQTVRVDLLSGETTRIGK